jgi:hypothetical protein
MSSPDPFSARFDSIEIDPARAPSQAALDHALAIAAPSAATPEFAAPGFYLIDDAKGRFDIDRDFGVISLRDESILSREHGAVHTARVRVVEQSGASYDMDMQLRLTGRVPQMVGAEDNAFLIGLATGETQQAAPAATTVPAPTPPIDAHVEVAPWTKYAAAHGSPAKAELVRTRRAFIAPEFPVNVPGPAALSLSEPLPPVGLSGDWSY